MLVTFRYTMAGEAYTKLGTFRSIINGRYL